MSDSQVSFKHKSANKLNGEINFTERPNSAKSEKPTTEADLAKREVTGRLNNVFEHLHDFN